MDRAEFVGCVLTCLGSGGFDHDALWICVTGCFAMKYADTSDESDDADDTEE